jgi:hypothetical protein
MDEEDNLYDFRDFDEENNNVFIAGSKNNDD